MLRILSTPKRLCDGLTRREALRVGGLGFAGLSLADFFRLREMQAAPAMPRCFGRAKACILLYLYGSPSQLETFDPKPDAPAEVRGRLGAIRSRLPGCLVGELLPQTAQVMDRLTMLRSLTHAYPIHGVAYALTGTAAIDVPMELNPRDPRHHPFIGSVVAFLDRANRPVPTNLALPFPFSTQRSGEVHRAGPYAAFLGAAYNPIWTTFRGTATGKMTKTLNDTTLEVDEPYISITPESRFELQHQSGEIHLDRLERRRSLLQQFEDRRRDLDRTEAGRSLDRHRAMAVELVRSTKIRDALNLSKESRSLRESYGMSLFGQGCLAARRLIEAGSRFVSVFWDEYGLAGSAWDTHWDHYNRMTKELCPGFDRALSGLIRDLEARGLLDETLIVCVSEHGRTPKLNQAKGAGRDHWSQAYSAVMAGGGIAAGRVIGKTDAIAGSVTERPLSPKDILATMYHLLGIDPHTLIEDRTGRPSELVPGGQVITEALA